MSKHEFNVYGLPTHELPLFQEKPGREWVDYGYDNAYGDYLRDLYLGSSIQSAVVSGVSEMIYGEGLDATDREEKPEQWLKTQKLLENSDENILRQLCFDLKLYGQCYVQVIWNRVRTEIAELRFIPAHSVRTGIADAQGKVDCYYVSPDWSRMRESRYAPVKYPAFDTEDRTEPASVYQIKAYQPGIFYYGCRITLGLRTTSNSIGRSPRSTSTTSRTASSRRCCSRSTTGSPAMRNGGPSSAT